jgi:hypothetical protein
MITFQQLEEFFSDTRETYKSGRSSWSIDDTCRWSYFFVDPDLKKFGPVADHLETLGYEVAGTLDPEASDEMPVYYLRVDRVERHTPQSLHELNQKLYGVARQFGLQDYDGMDVGAADGP